MSNDRSGEKPITKMWLRTRVALGVALLAGTLAAGIVAIGCGEHSDERAAAVAPSDQMVVVSQPVGDESATRMMRPTTPVATEPERPAVPADSLAPDVVASTENTLVGAGMHVDITAESSADVVAIELSDGIHQKQRFVPDSTQGVWRTVYRVPLKPQGDRIGLAVTAKNAAGRWRRVWLFLKLSETETNAAPDSAG